MIVNDREIAVLLALERIGKPWHLHWMRVVAADLGRTMTEVEFSNHYTELLEKGCISHDGSLIYSVTQLGKSIAAKWRERSG